MDLKGKQAKPKLPKKPVIPNKEGFSRASFLYQVSKAMCLKNEALSRIYTRSMDTVTKKSVLKLDPSVKRTICKKCHRHHIAGVSSSLTVEQIDTSNEVYQIQCKCGKKKRYPVGKDREFVLFSMNEENSA